MIESTARKLKQRNCYVVNHMGEEELWKKLSLADVLHSENPGKVVDDWIEEYELEPGDFDVTRVDERLVQEIPTALQMGKVYKRLILQTLGEEENYEQAIIRVYNCGIAEIIDNYNASAYYAPSYILRQAYYANSFNGIG